MKTRQIFGLIVTVCSFTVFTHVANAAVAKEVAAGGSHVIVVKTDGTVWAWGRNSYGQLGNGDWLDQYTPVQVAGLDNVATVSAGLYHSLAVRSDGTVRACHLHLAPAIHSQRSTACSSHASRVSVNGLTPPRSDSALRAQERLRERKMK